MPPKSKKKKRKKYKKYVSPMLCGVKGCKLHSIGSWSTGIGTWSLTVADNNVSIFTCKEHDKKHFDKKDPFNFYDELGIPEDQIPDVSNGLDRFGFIIPYDQKHYESLVSKQRVVDNSESLQRLKDWREDNKDKDKEKSPKKFKPYKVKARKSSKQEKTSSTVKTKKDVTKNDLDDVLAGILG